MSDAFVHALAGDWIGSVLSNQQDKRLHSGFLAAVLAFFTHAWLDQIDRDYTPDWVSWQTDTEKFRQDMPYIAGQVTGLAVVLLSLFQEKDKQRFETRLGGLLGSIAPDIIDGVYAYLNPEAWRTGKLLLPWHQSVNEKAPEMDRDQSLRRTAYLTLLKLRF